MTHRLAFVCRSVTIEQGWGPDAHNPGGEVERTLYTYRLETAPSTEDEDPTAPNRQVWGIYPWAELVVRSTAANAFHIGASYELDLTSIEHTLRLAA
jgi:hypothetical protein